MELSKALVNSISAHIRTKNKARLNMIPRPLRVNGDDLERRLILGIRAKRGRSFSGFLWSALKSGRRALSWEQIHAVGLRAYEEHEWFDSKLQYVICPGFWDKALASALADEDARREQQHEEVKSSFHNCIDTLIARDDWTPAMILVAAQRSIKRVQRELRAARRLGETTPTKGDPFAI